MNLYPLLRPLLFTMDAEKSHELTLKLLKNLQNFPNLMDALLSPGLSSMPASALQAKTVFGIKFDNIVGLAAGLDKNAQCIPAFASMGFGFIETGTVTPKPQAGNDKPRLFRLASEQAIINRMGFNSIGLEAYLDNIKAYRAREKKFKKSLHRRPVIGLNIGKNASTPIENALDDYLIGFEKTYAYADYISVNISSPNTKNLRELQSADALTHLLKSLKQLQDGLHKRQNKYTPFLVKIAPDMDKQALISLADVCLDSGVDGIIATNTTISRPIKHKLANETGGLSGAPLTTLSTQTIATLSEHIQGKIPLVAAGGIMTGLDAKDKINAGADLLQIYSGFIYKGPALIKEIIEALA